MLVETTRENVCALIDAYVEATGLSEAQASKKFYGNTAFFDGFRRGENSISVKKLEELVQAFRNEWPPNTEWPFLRPIFMSPK